MLDCFQYYHESPILLRGIFKDVLIIQLLIHSVSCVLREHYSINKKRKSIYNFPFMLSACFPKENTINEWRSLNFSEFLVGMKMLKFYQIHLSFLQISARVYSTVYFLYFALLFSITVNALCTVCLIIIQMNSKSVIVNTSITESGYKLVYLFPILWTQKFLHPVCPFSIQHISQLPTSTNEKS